MRPLLLIATILAVLFTASPCALAQPHQYLWLDEIDSTMSVVNRIAPPTGYERMTVPDDSFAEWLRHLPLKEGRPDVFLYNGHRKANQNAQHAVVEIDVGNNDLQQCADAVMRLRAEYLLATGNRNGIHFNFTSGDTARYEDWINGYRPSIAGNDVTWSKRASIDSSYTCFRRYLSTVFTYAGSYSLSKELNKVADVGDIRIGDVFIQGGFPGHAVIVVDMAIDSETGEKVFLLAQSYMPAQDIHILRNPTDSDLSPWYSVDFGDTLFTPEWNFTKQDLKRFPPATD